MAIFETIYIVSLIICISGFFITSILDLQLEWFEVIFPFVPVINTIWALWYILVFIVLFFSLLSNICLSIKKKFKILIHYIV